MPPSYADLEIVVRVMARAALWDPDDAVRRARDRWVAARMDATRTPAGGVRAREANPWRLGVHEAISVPGVANEVRRSTYRVTSMTAQTAYGLGWWPPLSGADSCFWSAAPRSVRPGLRWRRSLRCCRTGGWSTQPGRDEVAALAAAPVPRTVVWLDELQRYLDGEDGLQGGVVRQLLNYSHPVVIIATIWPGIYADYTASSS